ncbi:MAG: 50S ribosomal protein L9 [Candidatus Eutrophobiaceae bacterium]
MEVILCKDVRNLGQIGACVRVRPGYARNFLIPQGKALPLTSGNLAEFKTREADLKRLQEEQLQTAHARAERLAAQTFTVKAKAETGGKLFGSINAGIIANAITAQGEELAKSEVRLPEGVLRTIGEHTVQAVLHSEVEIEFQIKIEAE